MPIYEYACQACGHKFDTLQNSSDEPLTHCPICQEPTLKKLVSASAFHLKGTGWYVTDFKNPTKPENTEKDKADNTTTPKEQNKGTDNVQESTAKERVAEKKSVDKPPKTDPSEKKS
ncbi:FmdB family zinc ribbon protein [Rickettsiella grylli]|uniref:Type I antifreeze protein n=1 Tax=Rickettsiella grylli TaxID=59196 RepID=A8PMA8_9COXI|nr:zinc ribbon domain-containing protein [Rickettsiella grylli]EDP46959.1 type I antifreeze protein [Rickettsiella grylli]OJA00615.1 type I antifreeze protein [Rickettsiella grylli]